jgi:hypothetical protein
MDDKRIATQLMAMIYDLAPHVAETPRVHIDFLRVPGEQEPRVHAYVSGIRFEEETVNGFGAGVEQALARAFLDLYGRLAKRPHTQACLARHEGDLPDVVALAGL